MQKKSFSQRMRAGIKPIADLMGIGKWLRQAYVEAMMIGERTKFLFTGRPSANNAILLAGSGRSGTTWITDVLCALPRVQQVFEPLIPLWNDTVCEITGWDKTDRYIRSIYLRTEERHPDWESLWQKILTGKVRNYWTDYERNSYFPDRFMVKVIRANMMLGYIHKQFQPRVIYVLRHPCAVVHSRLAVNWHADVRDILSQNALVEDHLKPWVGEIEREEDRLGAHAVWWAVENLVALRQLRDIPHFLVYYEDLIQKPNDVLRKLLPWLGYEQVPPGVEPLLSKPSRMSGKMLNYHGADDRLTRWSRNLSQEQQQRILSWPRRLGLTMYDETPLPTDSSLLSSPS